VQQACTIIQSAAHEDANIIFGAVMDEKMKDTVKITVIATGFREVSRTQHRPAEVHHSFATSHDDAMDFPDPVGPAPAPAFNEQFRESASDLRMEEERMAEASPIAMAHAGGEVISLDSMRHAMVANMVSNFEQDDLDVPAFLRKRGEVM
jgi:cell division protein FtsZ